MNVHEANENLLMLCRNLGTLRDTSKAERDAARLALDEQIHKENEARKESE